MMGASLPTTPILPSENGVSPALELLSIATTLTGSTLPCNRLNIAMQYLARELIREGCEPADVFIGIAKGLGAIMANARVGDADGVLEAFANAARDYHARSQVTVGKFLAAGEGGHG